MAGDTASKNHRPLQKDITKNTKLVIDFLTRVIGATQGPHRGHYRGHSGTTQGPLEKTSTSDNPPFRVYKPRATHVFLKRDIARCWFFPVAPVWPLSGPCSGPCVAPEWPL